MIRTQIVLSLFFLCLATSSSGIIWDGGGTDNFLGTAKNWSSNSAPKNDGSQTFSFQGSTRLSPVAGKTWLVKGLKFSNTSSAFKLTGGQLNVGDFGIQSFVAKAQTISNPIRLTANQEWRADEGDLVLNGAVDLNLKTILISGPNKITINGNITPGFIVVRNFCTLTLSGLVNCDVDVLNGTLNIDTNQPQPIGSAINFSSGTKLMAKGAQTCDISLLLSGLLTYKGNGNLQLTRSLQGSGSLAVNATGTLGLGDDYFSTFSGPVSVDNGRLELNGAQPGIPMLDGSLKVGNGAGSPGTAVFFATGDGILGNGGVPVIMADGRMDLVGNHDFAGLDLRGGEFVVDGQFGAQIIDLSASGQTAVVSGDWTLPSALDYQLVDVPDGAADPDLEFNVRRIGPGKIKFLGGGHIHFNGQPIEGEGEILVENSTMTMQRTGAVSNLSLFSALSSTLHMESDNQFGPSCDLLLTDTNYLTHATEHDINNLYLSGSFLENNTFGVSLFNIHGDLFEDQSSTIDSYLDFQKPVATVQIAAGTTLSTGNAEGQQITVAGGGMWDCGSVYADVLIGAGTVKSPGLFRNIDVLDTFEVPLKGDATLDVENTMTINPEGTLRLTVRDTTDWSYSRVGHTSSFAPGSTVNLGGRLEILLDPEANVTASNEFILIEAGVINGLFDEVDFPSSPLPDHFWTLDYSPDGTTVTLRLEPVDGAQLDLTEATGAQSHVFHEELPGVAGIEFTLNPLPIEKMGMNLQLVSVRVDSIGGPIFGSGNGSTVGLRLYRSSDQALLASVDDEIGVGSTFRTFVFAMPLTLLAGETYRLVLFGGANPKVATRTATVLPADPSSLMRIEGAFRTTGSGDVFPTDPSDELFMATLQLHLDGVSAVDPVPEAEVTRLALHAAPNPFNPRTTVHFDLPIAGSVRVDVIDIRGRLVTTLDQGVRDAGRYSVDFAGRDSRGSSLASGVYFIRLSSAAGTLVRKITLVQ